MYIHRDGEYEPITRTPPPLTNADKIKQAGNESEMASAFMGFLCTASCIGGYCNTPDKACHQCVLDWLEQEATGN